MRKEREMMWSRSHGSIPSWNGDANAAAMPVRWSSSERPLSVRTIWVNGVRHAILSLDDPLLRYPTPSYQRPRSSSAASDTSSSSSCEASNELEECLVKLRVALDSAEKVGLPPIENSSLGCTSDELSRSPSPALLGCIQNPLSERVLQWLDLANKGQPLASPLLPKRSRDVSVRASTSRTKRKLYSRSASIDVPSSCDSRSKQSIPVPTTAVPTDSANKCLPQLQPSFEEEDSLKRIEIQTAPGIAPQRYEPLRPLSAWPSTSKSKRPQLHIFIPSLHTVKTPTADFCDDLCSSYTSE